MVWSKRYSPPGASPGTLIAPPDAPAGVRMTAIHYSSDHIDEQQVTDLRRKGWF